ncbi:helix-turn-helix domain-containing protein [Lactobacillus sp. CBA3605]|uniref:helix-turn-helix domain-containing protein n=1 Tax=Lactobacillus sp. CBA3605 TaxID=2099788 RepID=UPI001F18A859|nr:helix-turn-helix transcriptional regulator [Lactobacillus sp. CBA3605]
MSGLVNNIKKLALANHLTIEDVGKSSGVGEKVIYRWDRIPPKIATLKKVGDYLGVDYRLLLPPEDEKTKGMI